MISVIIPSLLQSPSLLKQCLRSLDHQTLARSKFSVRLVSNTPEFKLNQLLSTLPKYSFSLRPTALGANLGFAAAVNSGIIESGTDDIVLLNDDAWVEPEFLTNLLVTQKSSQADMVATTIYLAESTQIDSCGFDFDWRGKAAALMPKDGQLSSSLQSDPDNWLKSAFLLSSSNLTQPFGPDAAACLYTHRLIDQVGLFDPTFFAYLEDVEIALRARLHGMSCVWAKDAVAHHHKHATSSTMGKFKQWQDVKNWWRITLRYPVKIWLKFAVLIAVERGRNLAGIFKS